MSLDELLAEAELGEEARKFKEGDLYRILIGFAKQEVDLAQEKLLAVNPTDADTIRTLQNEAWRGAHFQAWIDELIQRGDEAIGAYKQHGQTD